MRGDLLRNSEEVEAAENCSLLKRRVPFSLGLLCVYMFEFFVLLAPLVQATRGEGCGLCFM